MKLIFISCKDLLIQLFLFNQLLFKKFFYISIYVIYNVYIEKLNGKGIAMQTNGISGLSMHAGKPVELGTDLGLQKETNDPAVFGESSGTESCLRPFEGYVSPDTNGDGFVSREEAEAQRERQKQAIDTDGDGKISLKELFDYIKKSTLM